MQEVTGLARRVEWQVPFMADPVVAGFKKNGACSIYFGAEPVLQFDPAGRLRRAFFEGFCFGLRERHWLGCNGIERPTNRSLCDTT